MRWIGYVATILWWSGVVRSLSSLNRGHSYKISPKPCRVPGSSGSGGFGTCMFVWECIKSEGTHVGVCVDTFMFGSCCVRNETFSTTTATTIVETSTFRGQEQFFHGSGATSNGNAERPLFVGGPGRPLQKRPQAKPSSDFHDYGSVDNFQEQSQTMPSSTNTVWSEPSQDTARPLDRPTGAFDPGGFNDKIDDTSTISVRLPAKNQASNVGEALRTRPPTSSSWNNGHTHLDVLDSVAHETAYRPYMYNQPEEKSTSTERPISVIDHDWEHDSRPNFVSRPEASKKPTKSRTTPKPETYHSPDEDAHLSTGGTLAQTTHWSLTTEPAFVTKLSTTSESPTIITDSVNKGHLWSEHSWTPPAGSSMKPHWIDVQDPSDNEPERHQNRPSFESTESQQNSEYDKPSIGAAHYITTDDLGTALTRPRPTKRRKPTLAGTDATAGFVADRTKTRPTTAMTYSTTSPVSTTGIESTPKSPTRTTTRSTITATSMPTPTVATSATAASTITTTRAATTTTTTPTTPTTPRSTTRKTLGSVPTVSAVGESSKIECGVPSLFPRPETRIVGGKDAPFGRWPWQVSVRRTSFFGFSSTHRCGGAVLNANWIATAGHCVDDLLTSQIRIRVGDYDFSSVQERLPYVERGIAKKVVHPKYNFFTYEYDLALVRLESALVFAPHISPICLPATDDLLIGENATVTGWGRLSEGGTLPSVLQEVSVPIVSNDRCKSMFLRAGRHEFIPEIFLCAGYESGGQDSCQGDSGGPLQVRGENGRYFLAGIISWGIGCAEANLPGVCTRISKFVPWILKNVT